MELAVKTFKENAERAIKVLLAAIPLIAKEDWTDTLKQYEVRYAWVYVCVVCICVCVCKNSTLLL